MSMWRIFSEILDTFEATNGEMALGSIERALASDPNLRDTLDAERSR
jgi:hypothetical protein